MRKTNGFSLIELMIALGILTIIATVAVPKVQVWNARNRGLQAVMELLSDFSKARSIAGYTIVGNDDGTNKIDIPIDINNPDKTMPVYMGVRRQTAMIFRKSDYGIYQKQTMTSTWDTSATMLKLNKFLETVTVERVNSTEPSSQSGSFDTSILAFTSNGRLMEYSTDAGAAGTIISSSQADDQCGSRKLLQNVVFSAIIRSKITLSGNDSIWYRLNIDQRGDYTICTLFTSSDTVPADSVFTNGDLLDI